MLFEFVSFDQLGSPTVNRTVTSVQGDLAYRGRSKSDGELLQRYQADPRVKFCAVPRFTVFRPSFHNLGGFSGFIFEMPASCGYRYRLTLVSLPLALVGGAPVLTWLSAVLWHWTKRRHSVRDHGFDVIGSTQKR